MVNDARKHTAQRPAPRHSAGPKRAAHARPYPSGSTRSEGASPYMQRRKSSRRRRTAAVLGIVAAVVGVGVLAVLALGVARQHGAPDTVQSVPQTEPEHTPTPEAPAPHNDGSIVMTLAGDANTVLKKGESYVEGGCYAHDAHDGMITDKIRTTGSVDSQVLGEYHIVYSVEDSQGNSESVTRTVHVVDEVDGGWDTDGISVFMYHDVYDPANPPEGATSNNNMISTTSLEEQLSYLASKKCYYPSWAELAAYIAGTHSLPARSVALTFDDGSHGFLQLGIPLLEKYKIPATSFLICIDDDVLEKLSRYASPYVDYQSHSYDMHRAGSVALGHGGRIFSLTKDEIVEDLEKAAKILQSKDAFAYPFGDVSDDAPAALKECGYKLAFTTQYGQVKPGDNVYALPRMRVFGTYPLENFIGAADVAS